MNIRNEILKQIELRKKKVEHLNYSIACLNQIFNHVDAQSEESREEMINLFLEMLQEDQG